MHGIPHGEKIRDRDGFRDVVAGRADVAAPGAQSSAVFSDLVLYFSLTPECQQVHVNVPVQGNLRAIFLL